MSLPDLKALIKAFDRNPNKMQVLDLVRSAEEDVEGLLTPSGQNVRTYCQLLRALCNMHLTGPSVSIAQALEEAAKLAAELGNHKLAVFANWYGACCRLARLAVRGGQNDDALYYTARRLEQISGFARVQRMRRLHAVAAATRVECLAHMQHRPENFDELLDGALVLLGEVDQSDTRVAERTQLLRRIQRNSFDPGDGGFEQMPTINATYFALMHKPGDLLTTLPTA